MKKICVLILCVLCFGSLQVSAAEATYFGYTYDNEELIPSPAGYAAVRTVSGEALGAGNLLNPQDLFIEKSGTVYIADTGNNRILKTDISFEKYEEIKTLTMPDGGNEDLSLPEGVYSDGKLVYIADTGNKRVVVCGADGRVERVLYKPETDLIPAATEFRPSKLLLDSSERLYVLCNGIYEGAVAYNKNGVFTGFYGSNRVPVTLQALADQIWKRFMNSTQLSKMQRYVPMEYSNLAMDSDGFIYTCTGTTNEITGQVKKLNPNGNNVWSSEKSYGDLRVDYVDGKFVCTRLVDVTVDDLGFVTAIDRQRSKIFQYDREGDYLFVFGAQGKQEGTFQSLSAIAAYGGSLYVLDAGKGRITLFNETEYGALVRKAVSLHNEGLYGDAEALWRQVLVRNRNLGAAYRGIGKALYELEDYEGAMEYFRMGLSERGYSDAFKEFRTDFIRRHFIWFALLFLLFIAGAAYGLNHRKKRKRDDYDKPKLFQKNGWLYPFHVMFHMVSGYQDMRYERKGSKKTAAVVISAWFLAGVLSKQFTGFVFNPFKDRPDNVNTWISLLSTVGLFLVFTIVNWLLCTLFEGKGRLGEIFIYSAYALLPVVVLGAAGMVVSNFLLLDEGIFLWCISGVSVLWSGAMLVTGLGTLHEYSVGKTVLSLIFTVLGIGLVVFIILLSYGLLIQLYSFVQTIWQEVTV